MDQDSPLYYLIRYENIHGAEFVTFNALHRDSSGNVEWHRMFGRQLVGGNIPYKFMEEVEEYIDSLEGWEHRILFSF